MYFLYCASSHDTISDLFVMRGKELSVTVGTRHTGSC